MKFNFDKNGIKKYMNLMKERVLNVNKKYIEVYSKKLYELAPKKNGALASSFNISIIVPNNTFNHEKTTPDFSIPACSISDVLYISSGCPYLKAINYGTPKKTGVYFIERAETLTKNEMYTQVKIIGRKNNF